MKRIRCHYKRPASEAVVQPTCPYISPDGVPCGFPSQSNKMFIVDNVHYCRAHAKQLRHSVSHASRAALLTIDDYTNASVDTFSVGPLDQICPYCSALMFAAERVGRDGHFNLCCSNGKLRYLWENLEANPSCPEPLHSLLTKSTRQAKDFQDKIRCYNSALSFVSFGANLELPPGANRHGPPVCMLHGTLYHYSYALHSDDQGAAKFAQLYMYDHAEAQRRRLDFWTDLNPALLESLSTMLETCSPFV